MKRLVIDGTGLTIDTVHRIATDPTVPVALSPRARRLCRQNRRHVEAMVGSERPLYGITTGFGDLARVSIPVADLARLQENLIRSHAVGVGSPFPRETIRAALLLRANTLARGASGVRPELIDALLALLNADIIPVVPEKGSLGASGDLAPLAHLSLVLLGEGEADVGGRRLDGGRALKAAGLRPLKLAAKEGLALINGTPIMSAVACLTLVRSRTLLRSAAVVAAMSIEALRGSDQAFDERIHALRPHPGQVEIARFLRTLMATSPIRSSHERCDKVQDAYSLRCTPQVLGAAVDAWCHARRVIEVEINAVTDNPLVVDGDVLSGGNFHGEPVGLVMDYLACAMAEAGSISERRTFRLLTTSLSDLPPFLVQGSGVNSGLMITQYTAAALVSENKILAHPATVDSIPSSADQEDHVSMATTAARKAAVIVDNVAHVLAIEYVCAAQAIDLLHPLKPSPGTGAAWRLLRRQAAAIEADRCFGPDMAAAHDLLVAGAVDAAACRKARFTWNLLD